MAPDDDKTQAVTVLTKDTVIRHYRIVEKIGAGGMGEVYLAEDTELNRKVALKFLSPHLCQDADCRARFKREAQAAAKLSHPNIVTIHEVSEFQGRPFLAMEFVEGHSLRELIKSNVLSLERVIDVGSQICEGLYRAHSAGVVHRDIKPANILIDSDGRPKIADFGLATIQGSEHLTKAGSTLGTAAYMSPEQARGEEVDARTDLWSLGVVIYEMVTGTLPFRSEHEQTLIYSILHDEPRPLETTRSAVLLDLQPIINRLLKKDSQSRYSSASDVLKDLQRYKQTLGPSESGHLSLRSFLRRARKPRFAVSAAIAILAVSLLSIWFFSRQAKITFAREELLPRVERLVEAGRDSYAEAYKVAVEARQYIPRDSALTGFLSRITRRISIRTEPPGAKVYMKEYRAPEREWEYLGVTPLDSMELPIGFFRWKMEKDGYETIYAAASTYGMNVREGKQSIPNMFVRILDKSGSIPAGMVRVAGKQAGDTTDFEDFFIDQYEVTNRQFKDFVDKGGYQKREYWRERFNKDGRELTWDEAIKEFVDQTGRSGPATWQAGSYPETQDDYPVSGLSWYEASAYAEFVGKSLPTAAHWRLAVGSTSAQITRGYYTFLAPMSNFRGEGPVRVGSYLGMTSYGAYDMAGNVREWCSNETPQGRIIRGGAWNDATYMFGNLSQALPFDRSPKNGVRCVVYINPEKIPRSVFELAKPDEIRDFYKEKPVSDQVFQAYREQFSYDKTDLNARVEEKSDSSQFLVMEKVTFDAAYKNERMIVYLLLPKNSVPPYQTVIYFPGSGAIDQTSRENLENSGEFKYNLSFIVKSGRAIVYPVYKGTFERGDSTLSSADENSYLYTEWLVKMVKDFKRSVDYLETRPDIDATRLAYFGASWGGYMGAIIPAVEDRLNASILQVGAIDGLGRPEARDINYVGRVTIPTLMLNGRYDMACPYETAAKPMFDLLGTPREQKELKLYETDHFIPRNELIKETLGWLDRYLGPVRSQ
jgi:eukaryotic-like serine/threonine-protein kinase